MKAFVHPGAAARARLPVRIFLVFAALALLGFGAQRVIGGGLSPAEVEAHYLGALDGEALSLVAIWEEVHGGAFLYGFLLFMLASLLALSPISSRVRASLVALAFVSTLADLFAPFAIVAAHGGGAIRVATFGIAWSSLAILLAIVAHGFAREVPDRA